MQKVALAGEQKARGERDIQEEDREVIPGPNDPRREELQTKEEDGHADAEGKQDGSKLS